MARRTDKRLAFGFAGMWSIGVAKKQHGVALTTRLFFESCFFFVLE